MTYISPLTPHQQEARKLVILGSTGSIGCSTIKVLAEHPNRFEVLALAGARNARRLAEQAAALRPPFLAVLTDEVAAELKALLPAGYTPAILVGPQAYVDLARMPEADIVLAAQVGAAGLPPAFAAARAGKIIALANKEALVLAGHLFRQVCHETGAVLLPVDSEHNALFQGMWGHDSKDIRRLVITASGGPFRGKSLEDLRQVTREQALAHPNWSMGAKISIDSATLMNKGLEVIEAFHLFGLPLENIDVVVHPQSVIHSIVEYVDRTMLAHMGPTDMMLPIAYALGWPDRLPLSLEPLDLVALGQISFEAPAMDIFPCLRYAFDALRAGQSFPVVLNAANEIAVDAFLGGRIAFLDIPALVERALEAHTDTDVTSLDAILALDSTTRATVRSWIGN